MVAKDRNTKNKEKEADMSRKIMMLFIAGLLTISAGTAVLIITAVLYGGAQMNFGTIIFIGPIPIVFGAGPGALWMMLVAIVLAVLIVVIFMIMQREVKKRAPKELQAAFSSFPYSACRNIRTRATNVAVMSAYFSISKYAAMSIEATPYRLT